MFCSILKQIDVIYMAIQNINVLIKGTGNAIDQTKYEIAQEFGIQFGPDKIPLANIYYNTSRIQV